MESGSLVKALYDFKSGIEGEISFKANDIIQISSVVDRYWLCGAKRLERGNFPRSFVTEISPDDLPNIRKNEELFVASERFDAGQAGDLMFDRGDIIIGVSAVDANWWRGKDSLGNFGIFPVTHAWKVDSSFFKEGAEKKWENLFAVAKMDMKAQLDEEIDLKKGDVVKIIEIIDKDWYRGESNGRVGIFPSAFVDVSKSDESRDKNDIFVQMRKGSVTDYDPISQIKERKPNSSYKEPPSLTSAEENMGTPINLNDNPERPEDYIAKFGYDENNSGITPYGRALFNFNAQYSDELSFESGEIIKLHRYIDSQWIEGEIEGRHGLVPSEYIDVIVDCPGGSQFSYGMTVSNVDDSALYNNLPAGSLACVLFDFYAQTDEDLTVLKGEHITLLWQVDNDWYQAKNNGGRIGLCPKNYVEVIPANDLGVPGPTESLNSSYSSLKSNAANELDESINLYLKSMGSGSCHPPVTRSVSAHTASPAVSNASEQNRPKSFHVDFGINQVSGQPSISAKTEDKTMPNDLVKDSAYSKIQQPVKEPVSGDGYVVPELHHPADHIHTKQKSSSDPTKLPQRPAPPVPLNDDNCQQTPSRSKAQFKRSLKQRQQVERNTVQSEAMPEIKKEEDANKIAEIREKNAAQRCKVLVELLQTERDYLGTLQLCYDVFLKNRQETQNVGIDTETLFGNLDEVMDVASRLLEQFENAVRNRAEEKQIIGACFDALAEDMKQAYGHYCRNHGDVNALLEKYNENQAIQSFINKGIQQMRKSVNCFDLGSVLITPVQRILKYPLLLDKLHSCTEEDHPDKSELLGAICLMSDVATAINEFKRRRDLVFKYRNYPQVSWSSKLSMHSVRKKSVRMGMRLSSTLGIFSVTKDVTFNECENQFKNLEKTARTLLKDLHFFSDQMQEYLLMQLSLTESICDYYVEKINLKVILEYRDVQRNITNRYWEDFKATLDNFVFIPLNQLLMMFTGPNNLIQKRNDKLLDYDNFNSKIDKCKDLNKQKLLNDELAIAKNNYKALNAQLLDELPKLIILSYDLIKSSLSTFIVARKRIIGRIARRIFPLMQLPLLISSQGDILQNFTIKHNVTIDEVNDIKLVSTKSLQAASMTLPRTNKDKSPRATNNDRSTKRKYLPSSSKQSPSQKVYLSSKYPHSSLYSLMETYTASDILDISADAGTIVGVIQKKDPMGSESRWFVDTGTIKGFIPSNVLQPHSTIRTQAPPSYETAMSSSDGRSSIEASLMNFSPTEAVPPRAVPRSHSPGDAFDPLNSLQTQNSSQNVPQDLFSLTFTGANHQNTLSKSTSALGTMSTRQPQKSAHQSSQMPERYPSNSSSVLQGLVEQNPNCLSTFYSNISAADASFSTNQTSRNSYANVDETASKTSPTKGKLAEELHSVQELYSGNQFYVNVDEFNPKEDRYDVPNDEEYDSAPQDNRYEKILCGSKRYEEIPEPGNGDEKTADLNRYEYINNDESPEPEYFYALYAFKSTGKDVLTLAQGQVVLVHHKQDTERNPEWWFVEDRYGNKGYAPASYLTPYENNC